MVETETNGQAQPKSAEEIEDILIGEALTTGYKPTVPDWALYTSDWMPQIFILRDIELMLLHDRVRQTLDYYKSGIAGAEFWGGPNPDDKTGQSGLPISDNPEVAKFVQDQCELYWDRGIPKLQAGYDYGWVGCETLFNNDSGKLCWEDVVQFSPRDTFLLTQGYLPVGVRVKNIQRKGQIDLWMGTRDVPAKVLWYAHNPRYNQFYGQSQLLGAWKAWRRVAWKDGLEMIIDAAIYRHGVRGPIGRFPEEDKAVAADMNVPFTTADKQGVKRRYSRDMMQRIGEQYKAGAAVSLSSARDDKGNYKWDLTLPDSTLNVSGLIEALKLSYDCISYGIGVPPELLEASETGSGYSGRAIPMEAFLDGQQKIADRLLWLFVDEVLAPLVRWNFGQEARFTVKVKRLLQTKRAAGGEQQKTAGNSLASPQPPATTQPQPEFPSSPFSLALPPHIVELKKRILRGAA